MIDYNILNILLKTSLFIEIIEVNNYKKVNLLIY